MSPSALYRTVTSDLRAAYDGSAETRAASERETWKHAERQAFLTRLQAEGKKSLFEVGAGGGHDSQFFADNGLQVVATDLSPQMVEMCRRRGLDAKVMDVVDLRLPPKAFQSSYSMNSLLHVPNSDLELALLSIRRALEPGALCYVGVYGAKEPFEGILPSDVHSPQRFFSFRTNEQLLAVAERVFRIEDFHVLDTSWPYQSLTLRVETHHE
jgi:SAM-dependent methyltransferase